MQHEYKTKRALIERPFFFNSRNLLRYFFVLNIIGPAAGRSHPRSQKPMAMKISPGSFATYAFAGILFIFLVFPLRLSAQLNAPENFSAVIVDDVNGKGCLPNGVALPFIEDWSNGNTAGFWTFEDNWVINGQIGNPEPSAEFKWDPILTNYSESLISDYFNGVSFESKDDPYVDGDFILEFDLKLESVHHTGDEYLYVVIQADGIADTVAFYNNSSGNIEWERHEINISEQAFGKVFRVQFMASGAISCDILSWYIDNISIERICYSPRDLMVEGISYDEMDLYWSPPLIHEEGEWISLDDGVMVGGIGLTGGGVFSVAARWEPYMLLAYHDKYITKVRIAPYNNAITTSFTLKIWKGPQAAALIYEEALSNVVPGDWNYIELSNPVPIDISDELWVGYTCDSPDGENPAGHNAGPAVSGYGDMITLDGIAWDPISSFGSQFDINWSLQVYVDGLTEGNEILLNPIPEHTVYTSHEAKPVRSQGESCYVPVQFGVHKIKGYHVYYNDDGAGYEFIGLTQDTFYIHHKEFGFEPYGLHCYYVVCVYEDCEASSDEACWLHSAVRSNDIAGGVVIYPNPARDKVHIRSEYPLKGIRLTDHSGRLIDALDAGAAMEMDYDVSSRQSGIYFIQAETETTRLVQKLIILD